jgi:tetratricopeptide (TPR) repeat protein
LARSLEGIAALARDDDPELAKQALADAARYYFRREDLHRVALQASALDPPPDDSRVAPRAYSTGAKALTLLRLATRKRNESRFAEAVDLYEEARRLFAQHNRMNAVAEAFVAEGHLRRVLEQHERARRCFREARSLAERAGDELGQANATKGVADLDADMDALDAARQGYHEALALYRKLNVAIGEANVLKRLGLLCICEDFAGAKRQLQLAAEKYAEAGCRAQADRLRTAVNAADRLEEGDPRALDKFARVISLL